MAQKKRKIRIIIIVLIFFVYFFAAARPIPREIVLVSTWISSLTSIPQEDIDTTDDLSAAGNLNRHRESSVWSDRLFPFTLGSHFGYVDSSGQFAINRIKTDNIYLGQNVWVEYSSEPANIEIKNIFEETVLNIENARGYPVLLDNRVFILGSEQNSLSEISADGNVLWMYEFGAPLTCIDAAAGLLLTGSLDGVIEVFSSSGERLFYFEPGGSRYGVILGCAISHNGSHIGIISGIDQQRFLLFERFGNTGGDYRVIYHEFLGTGFRRPVRISFIDEDRRIVFERAGGIGSYNIRTRQGMFIPLNGEVVAIDESGDKGFFFVVTSHFNQEENMDDVNYKKLVGIKFPQDRWLPFYRTSNAVDAIFLKAPFKSDDVFLSRNGSMLVAGGGTSLISFVLEER